MNILPKEKKSNDYKKNNEIRCKIAKEAKIRNLALCNSF